MGPGQVIAQPPPGFKLDAPPPPPGFTLDETGAPPPPPGFKLDSKIPPPPPGFVVDNRPAGQPMSDDLSAFMGSRPGSGSPPAAIENKFTFATGGQEPKPPTEEDKRIYQMALPLAEQMRKRGTGRSVFEEAKNPWLRSLTLDPARFYDAQNDPDWTAGIQRVGADLVGAGLPASDEAKANVMAQDILNAEKAGKSFPHALYQGAVGLAGLGASLTAGGVAGRAAGLPAAQTMLGERVRDAASFGAYNAVPAIKEDRYGDAAKEFAKGTALGGALGVAGRVGESLPAIAKYGARVGAQTGVLESQQTLENGKLPTAREVALTGLLMAGGGGKIFEGKEAPKAEGPRKLAEPTPEEVASFAPKQAIPTDPNRAALQTEMGLTAAQPPVEPVPNASVPTDYKNPTTIEDQLGNVQAGDPAYKALEDGRRDAYLLPKDTLPTVTEKAFAANPPSPESMAQRGIEQVDTTAGTAFVKPAELEQRLLSEKNADVHSLVAHDEAGKFDPQQTIENFKEADKLGRILGHGEGGDSKEGATHISTGYDEHGREIGSILTTRPDAAENALREGFGATTTESARKEEGLPGIVEGRLADPGREAGSIFPGRKRTADDRALDVEEQLAKDSANVLYPQYDAIARNSNDVYVTGTAAMNSNNASVRRASHLVDRLWKTLDNDPKKVELFMRKWANDEQARGMVAQGRSPISELFLSNYDLAKYEKNKDHFHGAEEVAREVRDLLNADRRDAGVPEGARRPTPNDLFTHLVALRSPDARLAVRERAQRAGLGKGYIESKVDPNAPQVQQHAGAGFAPRFAFRDMFRKAGASKRASGQSEAYAFEPYSVIFGGLRDVKSPAAHNRFRSALIAEDANLTEQERAQRWTTYDGKKTGLVEVDLRADPAWRQEAKQHTDVGDLPEPSKTSVTLPSPIAKMWTDYLAHNPERNKNAAERLNSKLVEGSLAITGADSIAHGTYLANTLLGIPGIGKVVRERFAKTPGGMRGVTETMRDLADMTSPDTQAIVTKLENAGLLRTREAGPQADQGLEKYSLPLFKKMNRAMFGPQGIEDQGKVIAYKAIEKFAPELSEAQKLYAVGQIGGVYHELQQPKMVNGLRKAPLMMPFAGLGVTKLRGAINLYKGSRPDWNVNPGERKWDGRVHWRAGAAVAAWLALKATLDDDKDFASSLSHPMTLSIGGRQYGLLRLFAPILDFGAKVGLAGVTSSIATKSDPNRVLMSGLSGVFNAGLGYISPLYRAGFALANKIPYWVPDGGGIKLLDMTPPSEHPLRDTGKRVAESLVPGMESAVRTYENPTESPGGRIASLLVGSMGLPNSPSTNIDAIRAASGNAEMSRMYSIADSIANRAKAIPAGDQRNMVIEAMLSNQTDENRDRIRGMVMQKMGVRTGGMARGLNRYEDK